MNLTQGDAAPDFTAPTDSAGTATLSAMKGGAVIVYFYPKDNTPGCTTEAIAFRDLKKDFAEAGARVIGVSKDTVKKHDKFIAKNDLNFTLVSDQSGEICDAFGVWVEKNLYGRKYMGIERSTFLIDKLGVIQDVWRKVRVKDHVEKVLDAAKALS
jgi:peroxiredoxin Q/BCP